MKKWQLAAFLLFSVVAPCTYLTIRFNLFKVTSKLQIGLWGVIVLGIIAATLVVLVKYYLDGLKTKYSYLKQILQGAIKLILPLLILLVAIIWLDDNITLLKEALLVIIPCECVAVAINPLPKWCFDNNVDGLGEIADKVLNRGKKE